MLIDLLKRQTQTVVLLLEDLQWAEGSLEPVKQIVAVREQLTHLLVTGTYRDDERPNLPELFPAAHSIRLTRLDDAAIADLTQSMLGDVGTQAKVLDLLKRETEGNAFFMVETVRALAEDAGTLSEIGTRTLPRHIFAGGVGQIIRRRLSRVPDSARPFLQEMAVAGRWLDWKIMEASSSTSIENINTFLTACADAGVLEIVEGRWRFTHDKLRETLLRDLSETERHDLHRKVAIAIEVAYPNDESYHEILLEHWRTVGDTARELRYLVPVVRHLVDVRADFDRAVVLADHGLTLVGDTDRNRPALLNLLSKVKWQMNDYPSALQWAEQAQQIAERIGDQKIRADSLRIQGQVLSDKGDNTLAIDYFQQSMAIYHELGDRVGIADNLLTLGIAAHNEADYALASDYYHQSMAIYRELGDQIGIANNLGNLGNLAESQRNFAAAQQYAEQATALFQAMGNQRGVAICLSNMGGLAYLQGDYATARTYLQQGLDISRETGHRLHTAFALNTIGLIELAQDNLVGAASLFHEALVLGDAIDTLPVLLNTLVSVARLSLRTGADVFAAELAGLLEDHPALDDEVRVGELDKLKHELAAALPADELTAALERGKGLDAKTVAKKFLAENAS
jgi:tetratricopeptide (TPR) repeat protein